MPYSLRKKNTFKVSHSVSTLLKEQSCHYMFNCTLKKEDVFLFTVGEQVFLKINSGLLRQLSRQSADDLSAVLQTYRREEMTLQLFSDVHLFAAGMCVHVSLLLSHQLTNLKKKKKELIVQETREVAQLVEYLPSMHQSLGVNPQHYIKWAR